MDFVLFLLYHVSISLPFHDKYHPVGIYKFNILMEKSFVITIMSQFFHSNISPSCMKNVCNKKDKDTKTQWIKDLMMMRQVSHFI